MTEHLSKLRSPVVSVAGTLALCLAALCAPRMTGQPLAPISARAATLAPPAPSAPGEGGHYEYRRAADGLFYIDAAVNGRPMRFLLDTGASVVILTPSDARRIGLSPDSGKAAEVRTAGGKSSMSWATLDHVQIAGREVRQLRVAVAQEDLGVSLLGQNLLSRLASLNIEGDRLRLR